MGKPRFQRADGAIVSQREAEKNFKETSRPLCTKVQYASKSQAKIGLKHVQAYPKRDANDVRPKAVYQCPHCGYWHLTKQDQRKGSES